MLEYIIRNKIRFESGKGLLSIEDLWDLPLTKLNEIAVALYKKVQEAGEINFLDRTNPENKETQIKFEAVRSIMETKKTENAAKLAATKKKEEKQKLMALLEEKKDENLRNLSEEELQQKLAALS